ncbi:MAG: alginate export family protein [Bryobacteraceae bacterium]|nr:alginate export family protein [Bryobacteraceae bacterium]
MWSRLLAVTFISLRFGIPLPAQSPPPGRDVDDLSPPPLRFGPVTVGGSAGFRAERINGSEGWLLRPALRIFASAPLGESAEFRSRILTTHRRRAGTNVRPESSFEVQEAHLRWWLDEKRNFRVRIGRQRFRDTREWYFDEFLDALQLRYQTKLLRVEFALAKGISGGASRREQLQMIGDSQVRLPSRRYLTARLLRRADGGRKEELTWLGVGSRGRVRGGLRYWLELARLQGSDRGVPVRGWGSDLGITYRFRAPLRPTVTVLYAVGSGDRDPADGIDRNFRQTRLHGNSDRYDSLRRRPYYGRILAPELSNLRVMSLDFGFRAGSRWSFSMSAHDYRQVHPSPDAGRTRLDVVPSGTGAALGREWNLSFVWRRAPRLDLILEAGTLRPGRALPQLPEWVHAFRPELRYYF